MRIKREEEEANKWQRKHTHNKSRKVFFHSSSIVMISVQIYYASSDCYAYWTVNFCFSPNEAGKLDYCSACWRNLHKKNKKNALFSCYTISSSTVLVRAAITYSFCSLFIEFRFVFESCSNRTLDRFVSLFRLFKLKHLSWAVFFLLFFWSYFGIFIWLCGFFHFFHIVSLLYFVAIFSLFLFYFSLNLLLFQFYLCFWSNHLEY